MAEVVVVPTGEDEEVNELKDKVEDVEDCVEDVEECVEDLTDKVDEILEKIDDKPAAEIPIPVATEPVIDHDLIADKVVERLSPVQVIDEPIEEEEEEEQEESAPEHDEPPEHNSKLYKKLF
jgi:hypothetical protein